MIGYPPSTPTSSRKLNVSNNVTVSSGTNNNNNAVSSSSSTIKSTSRSNNNNNNSSSVNNNSNNKRQTHIQWRSTNVQQGVIKVDSKQLYSLLKTEPILKYYELDEEPFAQGAFASVRRVRSRESGQVYAAKFSSRSRYGEDSTAEIYHEIALLSLCSPSPRIVKLHDVFQTTDEIIIVMEFAPGGDMQTIIDDNVVPFEADVVRFVQHVVEGLAYLHHRKIAHLDIKPQNLVMMGDFPDCAVKVCDFEISRVILDGTQIRELLGTPEYVAPEILHYEPITLAADMWSLGVTVYVLLTGFSPFGGETDQETFLNISQAKLDFPEELFEDVSEDAIDFIKKLLIRNPRERITAKECLRHPWLANNKKKSLTKKSVNQSEAIRGGRAGCSSCSTSNYHQQNLRKYLSKSREALFERVISKHKQHSLEQQTGQNLRKSTLLSQYDKTKRMCESQMSLVSKSRERLMQGSMSPSITKSREKLYGIKCLSKSHEVLNLCKTVSALASSSDNKKPLEGLLKTLTRAATASGDLISDNNSENINNFNKIYVNSVEENQVKLLEEGSSHQIVCNKDSSIILEDKLHKSEEKETVVASLPVPLIPDYQPLKTVLTIIRNNKSNNSDIQTNSIIKNNDDDKENFISPKVDNDKEPTTIKSPDNLDDKVSENNKKPDEIKVTTEKENKLSIQRPKLCLMKQLSVISSEGDDLNSPAISQSDSLSLTEGNSTSDSDMSEEDHTGSLERITGDISSGDDDEPRFTVKQLISAYNMHQEIVTKTSLEVTMNTPKIEEKILPVIDTVPNKKFPTGPNALRLFIPDLYITKSKRSSRRKHSTKKDDDNEMEQKNQELKQEDNESEKDKTNDIQNLEKSDETIETKEIRPKTNEKITNKKNSLTAENIPVIYNRSSSLTSEISNDKTSGISSTMTSYEDIITSDNQKRSRSNRSSGIISLDGDNITEETVSSSDNTKKISISNRSSGIISSDSESLTENTNICHDIPSKIPKSNKSSGLLSSDIEITTENTIISSDNNTKKNSRSNRSSSIISSDNENITESSINSNDNQQRQRKISKSNRSSSIMSSDGETNLDTSTTGNQQLRQRKISRTNRNSPAVNDGDNIEESKSSSDAPRKISRGSRTSSEVLITGSDSNNSSEIPRKARSNRSSRVESFDGDNITSDVTSSSGDNQRKISRSNRSSGILSSDSENTVDDLNSTSNIPRIMKSNRSSRTESIDGESFNNEIITSSDVQQLKKVRSRSQLSNDVNNVTDILNKTSTTSSNIKNSEKTLSTGTPRLNRKSFPCSRATTNPLATEKTRRKSNPAMKPPFY